MKIVPIVKRYLSVFILDEFHRYKSWDNCHQAFNVSEQTRAHSLELAFYLASWGMYRGSSGLLQKNHLVHEKAVDILFSKEGLKLKCNEKNEVNRNNVDEILCLKYKLAQYYNKISFTRGNIDSKAISPTDTLLSKILLGTLGCVPAYDRYFISGLKEMKLKNFAFSNRSLIELFDFIEKNKADIIAIQRTIWTMTNKHYPIMKIIDMYFWQIGYEKDAGKKYD